MLGDADSWPSTAAYGFAHLGKSLFWYSSEIFFAYFFTELAGLDVIQMGVVLCAGFLVSAVIDILAGYRLQHLLSEPLSAAAVQFYGAIGASLSLAAVFLGVWMPVEWRFGYAVVASIAFRVAFATYDIPQNALMALATNTANSRLRIASTRIWFSGIATLVVAAAVGPLTAFHDRSNGAALLLGLTGCFSAVAIVSAGFLARVLTDRPPRLPNPTQPTAAAPKVFAAFWLLISVMFITSAFTQTFPKLQPYFATYSLRSPWWGGAMIVLMAVGIFLGQILWTRLFRRTSLSMVMLSAALLQIGALMAYCLVGIGVPAVAAFMAFLFGIGNGGVGTVQWAAFSETVLARGRARVGPSYGLFAASGKLGLALGGLSLARILAADDFRDPDSIVLIRTMTALPALGALYVAFAASLLFILGALDNPMAGRPRKEPRRDARARRDRRADCRRRA